MSSQNSEANYDEANVTNDPEFLRILGDLLEAVERGEIATYDRFARQYPRYAPALLEAALYALPVEARIRAETVAERDPAVGAGIAAAFTMLGIAVPQNLLDTRKAKGWSLGELSKRLLLPTGLTLKIERGQITKWPERLTERLAAAMETTRDQADAILRATAGNFRTEPAAFSAEGDPEIAIVTQRRQETFDFEEVLAKERLTSDQTAYWKTGL